MLYINGKTIKDEDLDKFNEELELGTEVVKKIIRNNKGNILVYTQTYLEN